MKKKMKFYLLILSFLWIGAILQSISEGVGKLEPKTANALQKASPAILSEKEHAGKMSPEQLEEEAQAMLSAYEGEKVGEVFDDNFYSFYGFSKVISQYVEAGGEKINLNLVVTYDEQKDITYIIWATPFLNSDF